MQQCAACPTSGSSRVWGETGRGPRVRRVGVERVRESSRTPTAMLPGRTPFLSYWPHCTHPSYSQYEAISLSGKSQRRFDSSPDTDLISGPLGLAGGSPWRCVGGREGGVPRCKQVRGQAHGGHRERLTACVVAPGFGLPGVMTNRR